MRRQRVNAWVIGCSTAVLIASAAVIAGGFLVVLPAQRHAAGLEIERLERTLEHAVSLHCLERISAGTSRSTECCPIEE